jgi:serine/threonine-protein kinase RsbW
MTPVASQHETIRISIPGRLDFLGILNHAITELGEYLSLEEEVIDALAIAVIEAGTNAIQHGSPGGAHSTVDFEFRIGASVVDVYVTDEGPGFDPSKSEKPVGPDTLLDSRGRGIFLMRSFMDTVDFSFGRGKGTRVHLMKRRAAAGSTGP